MFIASAIATALHIGFGSDTSTGGVNDSAAVVWLFLVPTSAYVGWTLAAARYRSFGDAMQLSSPMLVQVGCLLRLRTLLDERPTRLARLSQIRARYLLDEDANRMSRSVGLSVLSHAPAVAAVSSSSLQHPFKDYRGPVAARPSSSHGGDSSRGALSARSAFSRGGAEFKDGVQSGSGNAPGGTSTERALDGEAAYDGKDDRTAGMVATEELFEQASAVFGDSALLEICIAHYQLNVRGNRHLGERALPVTGNFDLSLE